MNKSFMTHGSSKLTVFAVCFTIALALPTRAGDTPPSDAAVKNATCQTDAAKYTHGALSYFATMLCMVNVQFPGIAEEVLYHLVVDMGLNPDTSALAAAGTTTDLGTKTHGGKSITGTVQKVVAPDTFAGTYDFRAIVKVDGSNHMNLYWTGSGTTSKGFLTLGGTGMGSGGSHLLYIRWDRTVETAQTVSVLSTSIQTGSTYLATVQPGAGKAFGDRALFAATTYNNSTKAVTVQMTTIGAGRGASSTSTTPACFMMNANGTKGGTVYVAKTADAYSAAGDTTAQSTQDGTTHMDAVSLTDAVTTTNGTGGTTAVAVSMLYSCADLAGAAAASKPFVGSVANFAMTLTEANAMFAAN